MHITQIFDGVIGTRHNTSNVDSVYVWPTLLRTPRAQDPPHGLYRQVDNQPAESCHSTMNTQLLCVSDHAQQAWTHPMMCVSITQSRTR
jgi:hypothetical protein